MKRNNSIVKNLSKLPNKSKFEKHHWADFIELKCIVNKDNSFTQGDFLLLYKERKKDLLEGDALENQDENTEYNSLTQENDADETFVEECFKVLSFRKDTFKEYYPFTLTDGIKEIEFKKSISLNHKIYLFLLFSSSLNYLKIYQPKLTANFEIFSYEVFRNLLPNNAEVHLFGSSNSSNQGRYTGALWKKIEKLASDLYEKPKVTQQNFSQQNVGDGGIDLVGWVPNSDFQPHLLTLIGQCACTDNWTVKQSSSSYETWKNIIPFSTRPVNVVFIPLSNRNTDGTWNKIPGDCLLLDRQRLIYHFRGNAGYFKKLDSFKIIDEFLKIKEPIF